MVIPTGLEPVFPAGEAGVLTDWTKGPYGDTGRIRTGD